MTDGSKPEILIVDDVTENIKILMDGLKSDYTTYFAKNGKAALEIAKAKSPDLILLDIVMPEMDGYEVCRRLKNNGSTSNIPVIFVTGKAEEDDETQGLELGAVDYVTKPFSLPIVKARVKNHLELKRRGDLIQENIAELKKADEALQRANADLMDANKRIMESIWYAHTIQTSFLPNDQEIAAHLRDYFIIWKPRDVIGGDLYQFKFFEKGFVVAVMDCTGHGVPGAIVTMIAGANLDRALEDVGYTNPALVLNKLNSLVKTSLNQHHAETSSDDGLDAGLCFVDTVRKELVFAGARIGLYCVRDGETRLIRGDKQSVGYKSSSLDFNYVNHTVSIDARTTFCMCTDGTIDQTGGPKGLPFDRKNFESLLSSHWDEAFCVQKQLIEKAIETYRGDEPQLDDITVVGFTV
ncbi:response regulator [Desulfomonile tiedjei]|uniref:Response regulator containing a CheY-like receiver domain and an HD-GYP domain n=1 Tax=Desulfomonile tiedjei (strain ATCC 49306 / DSM 6799 / DCB-1) TaxID=706587 RepID=I4C9H6_DESTA|nr:response regulator [Desulfomonile tiedjei]AFM26217.1 response regulator containing a CheY-like receiver domain and an HD-GYP domain [Desulfomonile tiedjei DSM 6799]